MPNKLSNSARKQYSATEDPFDANPIRVSYSLEFLGRDPADCVSDAKETRSHGSHDKNSEVPNNIRDDFLMRQTCPSAAYSGLIQILSLTLYAFTG